MDKPSEEPILSTEEKPQSCVEKSHACLKRTISQGMIMFFFVYTNIFNYLERSLLPGCVDLIQAFIAEEYPDNKQFLYGLLQSAFILGYSVASALFGYYSDPNKPFFTISLGIVIWLFAVVLTGLSPNYCVLFLARVVSGVGEASFQIVVPAYIDDYAPQDKVGRWLAYLYCAMPVGSALGFSLSGIISEYLGWRFLFFLVPVFILPVLVVFLLYPYDPSEKTHTPTADEETSVQSISYCKALYLLTKSLTFDMVILGDAVIMFVGTAVSSFISKILMGLKIFDNESTASLAFGILGASAGFIGTYVGGQLLDRMKATGKTKLVKIFVHLVVTAIGTIISGFVSCALAFNRYLFLGGLFFTCSFLYSSNSSYTLAVLTSVPSYLRPMALGIGMILIHLLGDVPSPAIFGAFLDFLIGNEKDPDRLYDLYLIAMLAIVIYGCFILVFWGIGYCYVRHKYRNYMESTTAPVVSTVAPEQEDLKQTLLDSEEIVVIVESEHLVPSEEEQKLSNPGEETPNLPPSSDLHPLDV